MKKRIRFDDICCNTNMDDANAMANFVIESVPNSEVIFCVSPLIHNMSGENDSNTLQRIFPKIFNAYSDYRKFYTVDLCGIPKMTSGVVIASHGLIHVDHRLLHRSAQELSILASCSLVKSNIFVPPFNKWNKDTEIICKENNIELIKFEDGWLSMEHNNYNPKHFLYYLHNREFSYRDFVSWFQK